MRTSKNSPEQIAQALRQAESGTPIVEICRRLQLTEQTCYRWKKKFGELGTPEIRELRQLRRSGKPTDNAVIERFHNSVRRECLTQHDFIEITDAQERIAQYRSEYNNDRPHSSFGNVPPAHFRATVAITASVSSSA